MYVKGLGKELDSVGIFFNPLHFINGALAFVRISGIAEVSF